MPGRFAHRPGRPAHGPIAPACPMIVSPHADGVLCVTQPDHAHLAAAMMAAWQADGFPERASRPATLLAIAHHDDGWREEDEAPTLDPATGAPRHFRALPPGEYERLWVGSVARIAGRSSYAAALVAQHFATIARAAGSAGDGLARRLEDLRDHWFTAPPAGADDPAPGDRLFFLRDFALLALADLLSLMACGGEPAAAEREGYEVRLEGPGRLSVAPDPFGGRVVHLSVPGRRLGVTGVQSDEALRVAWRGVAPAPWPVTLVGRAVPDPS